MPFHRFLAPEYADGVEAIRRSLNGNILPSARFVSLVVHGARQEEAQVTMMLALWGQLLDHDLTATAQPRSLNGSTPRCCGQNDNELHPSCLPIKVPIDDPWLSPLGVRCLEFLRSAPAQRRDCLLSWREQTNQVTSYIDASPIYSSSARSSDNARIFRDGLLLFGRGPPSEDVCFRAALANQCIRPGDARSGEQPGLMMLHMIWVNEHNQIATRLSTINPHWSDEKLYQETRRIVGAMFQHITYREFLPAILGKEVSRLFDLELTTSGFYTGYDPEVNPTVANEFAAAAFRFGHSLIQGSYMRADSFHRFIPNNVTLHDESADGDLGGPGSLHRLIRGMVNQRALKRDEFITPELTNHLFQTKNFPFGLDLAAINIQRGRDHGIQPYVNWRVPCGLTPIKDFDDLERVMGPASTLRLRKAYRSVDDIDLFVGGLAERPVVGGIVGPTFSCIIAQQFSNLRKGDRFWYENPGFESSFTPAQLESIRQVAFSQVLCRSIGGGTMQPHVFLPPDRGQNDRLPCDSKLMSPIDLEPWTELDPSVPNDANTGLVNNFINQNVIPLSTPRAPVAVPNVNNRVDFIPNANTGVQIPPNGQITMTTPQFATTAINNKLDINNQVTGRPPQRPGNQNQPQPSRPVVQNQQPQLNVQRPNQVLNNQQQAQQNAQRPNQVQNNQQQPQSNVQRPNQVQNNQQQPQLNVQRPNQVQNNPQQPIASTVIDNKLDFSETTQPPKRKPTRKTRPKRPPTQPNGNLSNREDINLNTNLNNNENNALINNNNRLNENGPIVDVALVSNNLNNGQNNVQNINNGQNNLNANNNFNNNNGPNNPNNRPNGPINNGQNNVGPNVNNAQNNNFNNNANSNGQNNNFNNRPNGPVNNGQNNGPNVNNAQNNNFNNNANNNGQNNNINNRPNGSVNNEQNNGPNVGPNVNNVQNNNFNNNVNNNGQNNNFNNRPNGPVNNGQNNGPNVNNVNNVNNGQNNNRPNVQNRPINNGQNNGPVNNVNNVNNANNVQNSNFNNNVNNNGQNNNFNNRPNVQNVPINNGQNNGPNNNVNNNFNARPVVNNGPNTRPNIQNQPISNGQNNGANNIQNNNRPNVNNGPNANNGPNNNNVENSNVNRPNISNGPNNFNNRPNSNNVQNNINNNNNPNLNNGPNNNLNNRPNPNNRPNNRPNNNNVQNVNVNNNINNQPNVVNRPINNVQSDNVNNNINNRPNVNNRPNNNANNGLNNNVNNNNINVNNNINNRPNVNNRPNNNANVNNNINNRPNRPNSNVNNGFNNGLVVNNVQNDNVNNRPNVNNNITPNNVNNRPNNVNRRPNRKKGNNRPTNNRPGGLKTGPEDNEEIDNNEFNSNEDYDLDDNFIDSRNNNVDDNILERALDSNLTETEPHTLKKRDVTFINLSKLFANDDNVTLPRKTSAFRRGYYPQTTDDYDDVNNYDYNNYGDQPVYIKQGYGYETEPPPPPPNPYDYGTTLEPPLPPPPPPYYNYNPYGLDTRKPIRATTPKRGLSNKIINDNQTPNNRQTTTRPQTPRTTTANNVFQRPGLIVINNSKPNDKPIFLSSSSSHPSASLSSSPSTSHSSAVFLQAPNKPSVSASQSVFSVDPRPQFSSRPNTQSFPSPIFSQKKPSKTTPKELRANTDFLIQLNFGPDSDNDDDDSLIPDSHRLDEQNEHNEQDHDGYLRPEQNVYVPIKKTNDLETYRNYHAYNTPLKDKTYETPSTNTSLWPVHIGSLQRYAQRHQQPLNREDEDDFVQFVGPYIDRGDVSNTKVDMTTERNDSDKLEITDKLDTTATEILQHSTEPFDGTDTDEPIVVVGTFDDLPKDVDNTKDLHRTKAESTTETEQDKVKDSIAIRIEDVEPGTIPMRHDKPLDLVQQISASDDDDFDRIKDTSVDTKPLTIPATNDKHMSLNEQTNVSDDDDFDKIDDYKGNKSDQDNPTTTLQTITDGENASIDVKPGTMPTTLDEQLSSIQQTLTSDDDDFDNIEEYKGNKENQIKLAIALQKIIDAENASIDSIERDHDQTPQQTVENNIDNTTIQRDNPLEPTVGHIDDSNIDEQNLDDTMNAFGNLDIDFFPDAQARTPERDSIQSILSDDETDANQPTGDTDNKTKQTLTKQPDRPTANSLPKKPLNIRKRRPSTGNQTRRQPGISIVPFVLLTSIERPDNWLIFNVAKSKKRNPLPEVPQLKSDIFSLSELPKPIIAEE